MTVAGAMPFTRTSGPRPDRQLANQVIDRRLADVVRLAARLRHDRVRRAGQHDRRGRFCAFSTFAASCASTKFDGHVDLQRLAPRRLRPASDGSGVGIDRRGVDDDVEAAELPDRLRAAPPRSCRATVRSSAARHAPSPRSTSFAASRAGLLRSRRVRVGDHDVPAAPGDLQRDLAADAAAAADDHARSCG